MSEFIVVQLVASALVGFVPAAIAARKGYSFLKWWLFGWALLIIALPCAFFLRNKTGHPATNEPDTEDRLGKALGPIFGLGVCGFILIEVVSHLFNLANPEIEGGFWGGTDLNPLDAILCFIGGLALGTYLFYIRPNKRKSFDDASPNKPFYLDK